ncbi:hypothetical protein L873DRAFT_945568 [Choiromyces venosus 120613-1]|uniref:Uncharacterized protein n=1 Tax=Choiromyces venosus 120613-1 TaxID=1336337 RepID=A0A3N4K9K2_9PEZI|nr:hypothetical protein L873DRAFT_945568 [Choiromyces venosus 120613-1]
MRKRREVLQHRAGVLIFRFNFYFFIYQSHSFIQVHAWRSFFTHPLLKLTSTLGENLLRTI